MPGPRRLAVVASTMTIALAAPAPAFQGATGAKKPDPPATRPASADQAPMDVKGEIDSIFEYLARTFDADGDGRITADEYDRGRESFERLDRTGDGAIAADDFERRGGRGGDGPSRAERRAMRTQGLLVSYFQEEEPDLVPLAELQRSFRFYDGDDDGRLDRAEFEKHAERRKVESRDRSVRMMRRAMGELTPWAALVEGLDGDGDERVSMDELVGFFKSRDDGDLVWTLNRQRGRRGGDGGGRGTSGPPEGEVAPDFTLLPAGGGEPVTLSSFRERNLPVALIFGSYT